MRTSHREIKSLINKQKDKITDEEFFSSLEFSLYLTDIAEAISKRYNRNIRVYTSWDLNPNVDIAYTDNRNIYINCANHISQSFPSRELKTLSILGINGHELGHILYTNFFVSNKYQSSLKNGKLHFLNSYSFKIIEKKYLDEIQNVLDSKDECAIEIINNVSFNLDNIFEDVYIEAQICNNFQGNLAEGIKINNSRIIENSLSIQQQINKKFDNIYIMINLICQYCKSGNINNSENYKGQHLDLLYECIPIIDNCIYDDDSRTRFISANTILIKLWVYVKELILACKDKDKVEINKILSEKEKMQIENKTKKPIGSGTSVKENINLKKYSSEKESNKKFNSINKEFQEVSENEKGRIELKKTENISIGEKRQLLKNDNYMGSGYHKIANDIERVLNKISEKKVNSNIEKKLSQELKEESKKIFLGNIHKNISIQINRMTNVSSCYIDGYNDISKPLIKVSKSLQNQIKRLIVEKEEELKINNLYMGNKLEVKKLIYNDGRYFYKNRLPDKGIDLAVAILIDESGSMSSCDRITYARATSIIMYDFCLSLNIPILILGHTNINDKVNIYSYAEFDSIDKLDKYRIMDMSARNRNRDGAALRYISERLMKRKEEDKFLIIVSDGQPNANEYSGTAAEKDLRGIKREFTNKGIKFIAAAIGDDKENIERIYGSCFLDVTDINKLPVNLIKIISKQIINS